MSQRMKLERETICGFNDEEDEGWIITHSPVIARRLQRRLGAPTKKHSPGDGMEWRIPKSWIKLPSKKKPRKLTEEQRSRLAQNAAGARAARKVDADTSSQ